MSIEELKEKLEEAESEEQKIRQEMDDKIKKAIQSVREKYL